MPDPLETRNPRARAPPAAQRHPSAAARRLDWPRGRSPTGCARAGCTVPTRTCTPWARRPVPRSSAPPPQCSPAEAGPVLSHTSALALWGLAKEWPDPIHVTARGPAPPGWDRRPHQRRPDPARHPHPARHSGHEPRALARCLTALPTSRRKEARTASPPTPGEPESFTRARSRKSRRRFPKHPGVKHLAPGLLDGSAAPHSLQSSRTRSWRYSQGFTSPPRSLNKRFSSATRSMRCSQPSDVIVELDGWDFHRRPPHLRERPRHSDAEHARGRGRHRPHHLGTTFNEITPTHEAQRLLAILAQRRKTSRESARAPRSGPRT